ncbi:hypothetical protein HZH68_006092 [Vespula germanica]|uniref:Uncharacterized protein n=1 Tax=Vespula germanica TaxID=30212 RepID=A0A834KAS2_VESGE|nr:hypothetical protein HZH68_006092 [Vespula germanica]
MVLIEFRKMVHEEGAIKKTIITGLAEMMGTSLLVFLGCMGCVSGLGVVPSHLQITLNFGLSVMIVIQCFGHISDAHVNPAITVGSVVLGKKSIPEALVYLLAQTLGAISGYGMLRVSIENVTKIKMKIKYKADNFCKIVDITHWVNSSKLTVKENLKMSSNCTGQ